MSAASQQPPSPPPAAPAAPPFPEGTYTLRSHKWSTTIYEDASGTILHGARPPAGDAASVRVAPLAAGPPGAYSIASSATGLFWTAPPKAAGDRAFRISLVAAAAPPGAAAAFMLEATDAAPWFTIRTAEGKYLTAPKPEEDDPRALGAGMSRGKSYERFVLIPAVPDVASNANDQGGASAAVPMELSGASSSSSSAAAASAAAIIAPTASSSASSSSSSSSSSASSAASSSSSSSSAALSLGDTTTPKRRLSEPDASGDAADRSSGGGKKKARMENIDGDNEEGASEDKDKSALIHVWLLVLVWR